jgi:ATP-dependent DNA ligase
MISLRLCPRKIGAQPGHRENQGASEQRDQAISLRSLRFEPRAHSVPTGDSWLHELKHDGYRLIIQGEGARVHAAWLPLAGTGKIND